MDRRIHHGALELPDRRARTLAWFALIAAAYFGAAKLGISLEVAHGLITPVWAPSGIALAALLVLGVRFWPAVALGAFVANATGDATVAVAAGIAFGNTLAAVVGALLVRRIGFTPALDRVRSVLALVVGGAVVSTMVSATNGVTVLTLADARQDSFGSAWLLWWFGDAVGILLVAPILLVLSQASREIRPPRARLLEGALLLASVVAVSAIVFLAGAWRYPYVIFPLLLWAALRFKQLGAATTAFVVGTIATWGAVDGSLPLGGETATERVQVAQASFAVVVVSLLVLAATLAEREAAGRALATSAARLREAQALAHVGSWEWDIPNGRVAWSDELYRIFGLEPSSGPMTYERYLELVHPEDRGFVDEIVRGALEDGEPFAYEHRIVRPDGEVRIVATRGRVVMHGGEPMRMVGSDQDVTEQRQVERLREDILASVSHELRTPLTSVLGFALTLEKHRATLTPETIDETVAELAEAARRLDRLLADRLDVEQLRRGLVALRRERVDVGELVQRVVAESPLDDREVVVECESVTAEVDRAKLERIVENLVVNANKHTPAGSPVQVRLSAQGRNLLLVVDDHGPGIPDEFKDVVFETFNRGPNILATTPGAGIGLSLVARFAAVHGGRCWVEDRPGGGASFRVLLPDCVRERAQPAEVG
jgi:PAS domain S-box-containing protein